MDAFQHATGKSVFKTIYNKTVKCFSGRAAEYRPRGMPLIYIQAKKDTSFVCAR